MHASEKRLIAMQRNREVHHLNHAKKISELGWAESCGESRLMAKKRPSKRLQIESAFGRKADIFEPALWGIHPFPAYKDPLARLLISPWWGQLFCPSVAQGSP